MLLDKDVPGFSIAWQMIAAMALAGALVLLAIVSFAVRARRRPVISGVEGLLRETAEAIEDFDTRGLVRVQGELWNAVSHEPVRAGQRLRIRKVDGLTVEVEPVRGLNVQENPPMLNSLPIVAMVVVALVVLATQIFKVLNEYERGVIFTFGRFTGVKGPGLIILIPLVQRMVKVDLRTVVLDVPTQDVISRDNVSVKVNAVIYFRIVDPSKAIIQVANPFEATSQLAQTTLRSVLGQHELDEMLSQRDKLNVDIQKILDSSTDAWGIKVGNVEIKHVDLDETMIRAMAKQAEAERTRRAKIIHAEGEKQAAQQLVEAARTLGSEPKALQLRYLQTLSDLSSEKATTIVFPLPLDLIKPFLENK